MVQDAFEQLGGQINQLKFLLKRWFYIIDERSLSTSVGAISSVFLHHIS